MASRTWALDSSVWSYYQAVGFSEPAVLKALREETASLAAANMQISPEQGQLMQLLIALTQAKTLVEVGTFTGYSALAMALALPEEGRLHACDISEEWTAMGRRHWQQAGVSEKIELHIGPAATTLERLLKELAGQVDFVFIDADKTNYDTYYELGLQLLRDGGLIAIDNVLWGGKVADPSQNDPDTAALRTLNQKIAEDNRVTHSMIPIGDGLTLVYKKPHPQP